jgi:hypothetical protein
MFHDTRCRSDTGSPTVITSMLNYNIGMEQTPSLNYIEVTPTIVKSMRYYMSMWRGARKLNFLWLIVIIMNMRKLDHRHRL